MWDEFCNFSHTNYQPKSSVGNGPVIWEAVGGALRRGNYPLKCILVLPAQQAATWTPATLRNVIAQAGCGSERQKSGPLRRHWLSQSKMQVSWRCTALLLPEGARTLGCGCPSVCLSVCWLFVRLAEARAGVWGGSLLFLNKSSRCVTRRIACMLWLLYRQA